MSVRFALVFVAAIFIIGDQAWPKPAKNCKFLNESCENPSPKPRTRSEPSLSDDEHLRRCLADYVRRKGAFVPEGQSTKSVKSRSDMTAMCKFAIQNHNYYWAQPTSPDYDTNMRCCVNMGSSRKMCEESIGAAMRASVNVDYCYIASKSGEPPPPEWNVPAGCTAGTCLVTPGYCKYVGYTNMDAQIARTVITAMREQMAKQPAAAEQFQAVLRVCFGVR
jgi:hypothetical protein